MSLEPPLPTFIDLFCGCGGFSLGLQRAGLRCLAAIDFNKEAVEVFRANFPDVPHVLQDNLSDCTPHQLSARLGTDRIDAFVGGPPCQGFSAVRQVDAANHGTRERRDKRRYLFRAFLNYVEHFHPRVFVMENVLGLQSAAKGKCFTMMQQEARNLGYRVHPQVEEAWKLGVPQKRRRQLVIGVRTDVPGFLSELEPANRAFDQHDKTRKGPMLCDAIGDLPPLAAGAGEETCDYDPARRAEFMARRGTCAKHYLEMVLEIGRASKLTGDRARPHSPRDLRDFARLSEGESANQAIARGEKMEFTYDRGVFLDRYTRQHRERLCSTIVAYLAKDGLMFIHPTQNRSPTPREAASFNAPGDSESSRLTLCLLCEVREISAEVSSARRLLRPFPPMARQLNWQSSGLKILVSLVRFRSEPPFPSGRRKGGGRPLRRAVWRAPSCDDSQRGQRSRPISRRLLGAPSRTAGQEATGS